jgi:putative transposase
VTQRPDSILNTRKIFDKEGHAQFVTFSCYRRRRILDADRPKRIVISYLNAQLRRQDGRCLGFVVMPDHVHAIVWFPLGNQLSRFMQQWKRLTSFAIKKHLKTERRAYSHFLDPADPVWQQKYYSFSIHSEEKLAYMHLNPVRAGMVGDACDWSYSSARWYLAGESVGVRIGFA